MTVQVNNDSKILRGIIEDLQARVLKLENTPRLVRHDFSNLVANGTFSDTSAWVLDTDFSISGGVLTKVNNGVARNASQAGILEYGIKYTTSFTVSNYVSGNFSIYLGVTGQLATRSSNGTTVDAGYALGDLTFYMNGNNSSAGDIDNVLLFECDPSDDAAWFRLPQGFKVGKHGIVTKNVQVLQPSEYTEIQRGDQYFIKPNTAPGVTDAFAIWAYRE